MVILLGGVFLFSASVFLLPGPSGFAGPLKNINNRFHGSFPEHCFYKQSIRRVLVEDHSANLLDSLPANSCCSAIFPRSDVNDISFGGVEEMIREVVSEAGGLSDIISDGDTVILKPNMVLDNGSDPFNGVTTNPWVIEIAAKMVRELNPNGRIILLESTADSSGTAIMQILGLL